MPAHTAAAKSTQRQLVAYKRLQHHSPHARTHKKNVEPRAPARLVDLRKGRPQKSLREQLVHTLTVNLTGWCEDLILQRLALLGKVSDPASGSISKTSQ